MIFLKNYGWNTFHQQNYILQKGEAAGRVISIKGFKYELITEKGELETELSGKLLYGSASEELPKIGDWVSFLDYGDTGYIINVFPRMNALSRKNPGVKTERQVLAANVDHALIVQGLDREFNIMRLERYLTQVVSCKINPIVILNKADLVGDLDAYRQQVLKLKRDCRIFFCSTLTGLGISDIKAALQCEKTYIMIGSSGVGKSSLLNVLNDATVQRTQSVSDHNYKGTHTTTTRDLFKLPNGSLLIDSPGMREFGLTSEGADSSSGLFPAIDGFAPSCRYSDCNHVDVSGCAVIEALEKGSLDTQVYDSYIKLMKEQKRFQINVEDKKRMNKQFGKMTKEAKSFRKKYKY
jgi:ribosome biogenesis GTPase / thiamine phosphate phosphatase